MIPVHLLHAHEIGEGLFPVGVPVIRAGAVEAGVNQDGEVFQGGHGGYFMGNVVCPLLFCPLLFSALLTFDRILDVGL